jgi:hypothetical protein
MNAKRVRLLLFVGDNPIPYAIDGVHARGLPPDDLHVHMSVRQLQTLLNAVTEQLVARGTKLAGEALGAAVVDAVEAWQTKRRRRKLSR